LSADARYIIGIDLGTTNIAVAYLDSQDETAEPQLLTIPQVTNDGEVDELDLLPSFLYLPDESDYSAGSLDLPWAKKRDFCVGALARKNASTVPGKTISSAKSWLCAPNVDRLAPILPWNRDNLDRQLSPVDAAQRCLEHIRDVWNNTVAQGDAEGQFQDQDVILTVPASFDAVARDLTVRAAQEAGIKIVLLEEPQAAFYSWLQEHAGNWRDMVAADDRVLVCDIGGGTTDFSLIEVNDEEGNLSLQRVAVGDHILLGGDNMDLTLAYTVAARLQQEKGTRLDNYQLAGLTHACREAKEVLCADPEAPAQKLTVLGRGSSVIGGTISTELTVDDLNAALVDGFFPKCALDDEPNAGNKAGLRAFGLDYAADPGITRHLAAFLSQHKGDGSGLPAAVLFNGGVSKATVLRDRVTETLSSWLPGDAGPIKVVAGTDPDRAVALGACWFGNVRRGNAIRIKAGSNHTYYVGVESSMPAIPGFTPPVEALCVVPFGMEEGTQAEIPYTGLGLIVGESTEFRFFASNSRNEDDAGLILGDVESPELQELPVLTASLELTDDKIPSGTLVPVQLESVLSEIGTLQVWCNEVDGDRRWKLEYEVRDVEVETSAEAE
jgi:molecular chaperone DnaK (HSP70)